MRVDKRSWSWAPKLKFEGRVKVYWMTTRQKTSPDRRRVNAKVQRGREGAWSVRGTERRPVMLQK